LNMKMREGIALVVTLMLALIALTFTGAMLYMLISGTRMSGVERRYATALEAAKGAADYIIEKISNSSLNCIPNCDTKNASISLGSFSTFGAYNVNATLLSKTDTGDGTVYAVEVITYNSTTSEKSIIDFVYRIK